VIIRFHTELEAIREMSNVIKEAIEVEARLPNELVLEGEKFKVNFDTLTYEPEPEPRPESPVEKQCKGHTLSHILSIFLFTNERFIASAGSIHSVAIAQPRQTYA
jgi:hypothetical protein